MRHHWGCLVFSLKSSVSVDFENTCFIHWSFRGIFVHSYLMLYMLHLDIWKNIKSLSNSLSENSLCGRCTLLLLFVSCLILRLNFFAKPLMTSTFLMVILVRQMQLFLIPQASKEISENLEVLGDYAADDDSANSFFSFCILLWQVFESGIAFHLLLASKFSINHTYAFL